MYYQIPVTDSAGRVIQHLPVERTERKSNGGIAALFARFSFKTKSRADIVKLVYTPGRVRNRYLIIHGYSLSLIHIYDVDPLPPVGKYISQQGRHDDDGPYE